MTGTRAADVATALLVVVLTSHYTIFYSGNTPNTLVLNASEVSCFLESYRDWYQVQALLGACACVCYGTRLSSASLLLRAIV